MTGRTFAIGGLLETTVQANAQKVPYLGELPLIGAMFSSVSHQEIETELIILVTPEFVAPMPAGQLPSVGPGMFTDTPVDRELFGHGHLEVPKIGEACDHCQNGVIGGACQNPSCPNCKGSGDCAVGTSKPGTEETPVVLPTGKKSTKAVPASTSSAAPVRKAQPPTSRKGNTRSGGSGLISPTMR